MVRPLVILIRRRRFWLALLLTVWLLCSGQAQASPLADRLAGFPQWPGPPSLAEAQGDLVYPDWMQGTWSLTSTLVDLAAPLAPELITPGFEGNRTLLNQPVTCRVRFVSVPRVAGGFMPLVTRQRQIVADRAFNGLSLARAYLSPEAVKAVKVDPQNPNRQVTLLADHRQLESTVTARAIEAPAADRFITAERFQQVFRGATTPYFNQVEAATDYTQTLDGVVADQVTAVYLSPQDPDFLKAINQPVALYRYRLEFTPAPA